MERIVLEVDDTVLLLKKISNNPSMNSYKIELDNWGNEAVSNGLTQEELEKLLADD